MNKSDYDDLVNPLLQAVTIARQKLSLTSDNSSQGRTAVRLGELVIVKVAGGAPYLLARCDPPLTFSGRKTLRTFAQAILDATEDKPKPAPPGWVNARPGDTVVFDRGDGVLVAKTITDVPG